MLGRLLHLRSPTSTALCRWPLLLHLQSPTTPGAGPVQAATMSDHHVLGNVQRSVGVTKLVCCLPAAREHVLRE